MLKISWSSEAGVVDDHEDLGLRVEVGAGAVQQLVELDDGLLGVALELLGLVARMLYRPCRTLRAYWPRFSSSRSWRSISVVDVERLLALALAALVAGDDELAHLLAQLAVAARGRGRAPGRAASRPRRRRRAASGPWRRRGRSAPGSSGGSPPRAPRRETGAIDAARAAAASPARSRGRPCRSASSALPAPVANTIAPIGSAMSTIRIMIVPVSISARGIGKGTHGGTPPRRTLRYPSGSWLTDQSIGFGHDFERATQGA